MAIEFWIYADRPVMRGAGAQTPITPAKSSIRLRDAQHNCRIRLSMTGRLGDNGWMIEYYLRRPSRIHEMRASPAGPYLDGFASELRADQFCVNSVSCYLFDAEHLGNWLHRRGLAVRELDEAVIARFARHLPRCRCTGVRHQGYRRTPFKVSRFLAHLRRVGAVATPKHRLSAIEEQLDRYCEWMRHGRGMAESTVDRRRLVLAAFFKQVGVRANRYTASALRKFVIDYVREREPSASNVTNAVRGFVRYAVMTGRCGAHLLSAIPSVASRRMASLPTYLGSGEITKMLQSCGTDTIGLRDHAMLLLLARLGLRPSDVARLKLEDIEWTAGRIRVMGKNRREAVLPLPQDAGDAILAYLSRRPTVADVRHVFLGNSAPFGPLESGAVSARATLAMVRAGVKPPRGGAYVLRHSLARRMLSEGGTLDLIGVVLRHELNETTAIYAKVDVAALSEIARPWPTRKRAPC